MSIRKYKSLRQMDDKEAFARVEGDYTWYKAHKDSNDIPRAERYMAIYQALDSVETMINEGTGKIEQDTSRFSNTYMPIGAAIVEAFVAMAYNTMFATDNYFKMSADNWEDELFAKKITAHMKKRHKEMKFKKIMCELLIDMAIFPYAISGTRWLLRPGYVPKREKTITHKKLGKLMLPYQEVKNIQRWVPDAIDRPDVFRLNYYRFYHDPGAEGDFDKCEQAFDDYDETIENLIMRRNNNPSKYKNIDFIIDKITGENKGEIEGFSDPDAKKRFIGSRRVTIKRCWSADHIIEFTHGKIIRRLNTAGWPLQRWQMYHIPGEFNGMSILQRIERNQIDINASLNSRRDFQNLVDDPLKIIDDSLLTGGEDPTDRTFISRGGDPSKKIHVVNPGVNVADRTMEDLKIQMEMTEKMTVAQSDMGAFHSGRRSATEAHDVKSGSSNKTIRVIQLLEEGPLIDIYLNQFMLEQEFLTEEMRFVHFGKYGDELVTLGPEAYAWRSMPTFIPMGSFEMVDEPIRMQQFINGMDRALLYPQGHNLENIFAEYWSMIKPRDWQKFVKDPREKMYNIPAKMENVMIVYGQRPQVSPANDHAEHKREHNELKRAPDYAMWPETKKMMLEEHNADHDQAEASANAGQPGQASAVASVAPTQIGNANQMRGIGPTGVQGGVQQ